MSHKLFYLIAISILIAFSNFSSLRATDYAPVRTSSCPADVNLDGVVNTDDFQIINRNIYLPGSHAQGDVNDDGMVNFVDYQLLERAWGKTCTITAY